jgi:hypothetical protein
MIKWKKITSGWEVLQSFCFSCCEMMTERTQNEEGWQQAAKQLLKYLNIHAGGRKQKPHTASSLFERLFFTNGNNLFRYQFILGVMLFLLMPFLSCVLILLAKIKGQQLTLL